MADPLVHLDRRALLLGAGGALLATGCSGGGSSSSPSSPGSSSSGPIIRHQDPGNVISKADVDELVGRLNDALRDADVVAIKEVVPSIQVSEWQQRLANIGRFPMSAVGFAFDETYDRQVNASGGPLEIDAHIVLTHQIADVDSRPVVQVYNASLSKADKDAPVLVTELTGPTDSASPAPWDLSDWDVVEGEHVLVTAPAVDMARARSALPTIDRGAARAMAVIAPPTGVSKVFYALADPGSPLYAADGTSPTIKEASGVAFRAGYVDPQEAARSGTGAGKDAPYASSRLLLHPAAFQSTTFLEEVALHEAIHAMAYQWGSGDPWPAEGLARWVEAGFAAGLRSRYAGELSAGFAGFAHRMRGYNYVDYRIFHDPAHEETNYNCAAAVYGYLETHGGRAEALRFAERTYSTTLIDAIHKLGMRSSAELYERVQQWVETL